MRRRVSAATRKQLLLLLPTPLRSARREFTVRSDAGGMCSSHFSAPKGFRHCVPMLYATDHFLGWMHLFTLFQWIAVIKNRLLVKMLEGAVRRTTCNLTAARERYGVPAS